MSGERKDDHLRLAAAQHSGAPARNDFDDVRFVHHALAGIDADSVDVSARVAGWTWPVPLYVNGMTGGTERTGKVNRELAIAAAEVGVPIASGSVSIALDDPSVMHTFRVLRDENPHGFVMANLGAGRSVDDALRAVEALAADALQIHVNSVQETVMPEGSRDFSRWAQDIAHICAAVPVPVIIKEVGFGLSRRTLVRLLELGVTVADVSGAGGTDFVQVENARRSGGDYGFLTGWGQSAVCCLLDAPSPAPALLASGGVRSPLDVVRALALGARAVGVSGRFLKTALHGGAAELVDELRRWQAQLVELMAMLGARTVDDLAHTDLLLRGAVGEFCRLRGIDPADFSARSDAQALPPRGDHA